MSRIDFRPVSVLILAALALLVVACGPSGEAATGNGGGVTPGAAADSLNAESATAPVKMVFTRTATPVESQNGSGTIEGEFFGIVEAIDGNVWTPSGQQVTFGPGTEIKNDISVGSRVKVHTLPQADGTVLVREIELAQDDDDNRSAGANPAGEREFFGTVEVMNGNVWTVSGRQITIGSGTEIKGSISVGARVKVHATPQADGTLLVREIELARGDDDDDDNSGPGNSDDDHRDDDSGDDDNGGDDSGSDDDFDDSGGDDSDRDSDDDDSGSDD
ncbi:MAG: hypothetical protein GX579_03250 [Chloroflexi bacterium]|nr:hypothetical protein [Chloroflexota bacterium]